MKFTFAAAALVALLGLSGCAQDSGWCADRMQDSYCQQWNGLGDDPRTWWADDEATT